MQLYLEMFQLTTAVIEVNWFQLSANVWGQINTHSDMKITAE